VTSTIVRAGLDLLDRDLGEPDVADLALVLQLLEQAELLLARHVRVDAVQLPEVDRVEAETAQAHLAALAQEVGAPADRPSARPGAQQAGLRRDREAVVGVQCIGDELLGDVGPVGLGRVDEVDAQLGQPLEHRDRLVVVGGRPQMPSPVMRMAPKPRRVTSRSPPMLNVPEAAAVVAMATTVVRASTRR
jgi:hypothetical protein